MSLRCNFRSFTETRVILFSAYSDGAVLPDNHVRIAEKLTKSSRRLRDLLPSHNDLHSANLPERANSMILLIDYDLSGNRSRCCDPSLMTSCEGLGPR